MENYFWANLYEEKIIHRMEDQNIEIKTYKRQFLNKVFVIFTEEMKERYL